ncbi:CHAT domain-containing protein [Aquincola sp. S2]|uniref:CHAT domain-containing protein n=1 Tax=Pseudaquabacterium terrae TaxID=2732868 RepID=A0ABX2EEX1_9BURK|nr:CHAT domain-containing protein [Aquabacterium terrae]NRF67173.1 CHAT domain-containing protein [Aquabacterium terrae]
MRLRPLTLVMCALLAALPAQAKDPAALIDHGTQLRRSGDLQRASEHLREAHARAAEPALKARAAAALGLTLYQMRRTKEAEPLLREAYERAGTPAERAPLANDLGNVMLGLRHDDEARRLYLEAQRLAPGDASLQLSTALNLARLTAPGARGDALRAAATRLPTIADARERAGYAANLGMQALGLGAAGKPLAYESLALARALAAGLADARLEAEALDGLGQLYEAERRIDDALRLTDDAVSRAQAANARDLLFRLEWRRGRLFKAAGDTDRAVAAYRRAVEHIEAVRQDIPIEYEDGRSSFRETLEPIYLGLAELLLAKADAAAGAAAQQYAREARNVVELVKRSELDDFLGERCTVESARSLDAGVLPKGTAVVYPIIFAERLEMLVETADGLQRRSQAIDADDLQKLVLGFADSLRRQRPYEAAAGVLYDRLLRPLDALLAEQQIDTLVIVPDGVLRLLPYGALHDGQRFAIEKYAVVTAPALSLTRAARNRQANPRLLLAGLSEPGPVVDQLPRWVLEALGGTATRTLTRQETREALALPGVKQEIDSLRQRLPSDVLLDQAFTLAQFEQRFATGDYSLVHIASHGVFSSSAAESFLLTYDGLLTIDGLQRLLRSEKLRRQPIDLLALSACQTAEGDDRAPLGLSGAALKARAGSALGTLWPVSDAAAMQLMSRFYARLGEPQISKAKALQQVQRSLIAEPAFNHPFHWGAFILVGSWL